MAFVNGFRGLRSAFGLGGQPVLEEREGLGSLNDPSSPLYQALVDLSDGIVVGQGTTGIAGLPTVTLDTAARTTAVYRAVQIICTIAALPLDLYVKTAAGAREETNLPEDLYITGQPNPEMTSVEFWKTCLAHNALSGNTFIYRVPDRLGRTVEAWPIHPNRVRVGRDRETQRKVYTVDGNTDEPFMDAGYQVGDARGELTHVTNLSLDGLTGLSPVTMARMSLQLGRALEEHAGRRFSNGSVPAGILTSDAPIDDDTAALLARRWEKSHKGLSKAHRIGVLGNGGKFQQVSMNEVDAQFLAQRNFSVQEIARLFGVPPHLLADSSNSTSWGSGLEEQGRAMVVYTLQDYSARFEAMISDLWLGRKRYAKWNYGGLVRGNLLQRYQAYSMGWNKWLTTNDIRRLEDLPPIEGGDVMGTPDATVPLLPGVSDEDFGAELKRLADRVGELELAA